MLKGIPSAGGIGARRMGTTADAGNEFFQSSQYQWDCTTNPLGPDSAVLEFSDLNTAWQYIVGRTAYEAFDLYGGYSDSYEGVLEADYGIVRTSNICRVKSMPVVDASFIGILKQEDYEYYVVYPEVDPRQWPGIGGLDWLWAWTLPTSWLNTGYVAWIAADYASFYSGVINRTYFNTFFNPAPPAASVIMFASLVVDPWFTEAPPPPPLPPVPSFVSQAAKTINVGQSGNPSGTGTAGTSSAPGEVAASFNYDAFCSAPDSNGRPRSAAWIKNCLANVDRH